MVASLIAVAVLPGCQLAASQAGNPSVVLQRARAARMSPPRRLIVADTPALRELCTPLGSRLGLLQVSSRAEWARLAAAVPAVGDPPDFRRGMVVGVACWAGTPANGRWPVHIEGIRSYLGDGVVEAGFTGGSYLPDGVGFLETAHAEGVCRVVAVDVDGVVFGSEP